MNGNIIEIDGYMIDTTKLLGQGAFGSIFEASKRNDPTLYCAKIIHQSDQNQNADRELFIINLMKGKENENIVKSFYANYVSKMQKYIIIMEKCESDLDKEIKSRNIKRFTEQESIEIMKQLFNGYKLLYENQIILRDIKPANILIQGGKYKICDFGVSKVYNSDEYLTKMTLQGTPVFKPPELCNNYKWKQSDLQFIEGNQQFFNDDLEKRKKIQHKVDIYSFGIMFYLLLTGTYPFELSILGIEDFKSKLKNQPFRIPSQFGISQEVASLVEKMLLYSPIDRIGLPEILQTQIFQVGFEKMIDEQQSFTQVLKVPNVVEYFPQITVILKYKPVKDWLVNLRTLFLERCHEKDDVIDVYRNYCDLCLQLASCQLYQNISKQIIQEYIDKFFHLTCDDIQFDIKISLENSFYIKEFIRIINKQFIPQIFTYEIGKSYGESYLRFMFIYVKLRNYEYNYWQQQGYQAYQPFINNIEKDATLSKEDLIQYLNDCY